MNFFTDSVKFSENLALNILNECGIESAANNEKVVTDVDIITKFGKKIDVQLSTNFSQYGDFRLDIVSAFSPLHISGHASYIYDKDKNFLINFSQKYNCEILKPGKIMQKGYLDFFFILFYNKQFRKESPDYIFIIGEKEIHAYMKERLPFLFEQIKINSKSQLDDRFGSAFIPIRVNDLKKNCACFFGSPQDLYANRMAIKSYIMRK